MHSSLLQIFHISRKLGKDGCSVYKELFTNEIHLDETVFFPIPVVCYPSEYKSHGHKKVLNLGSGGGTSLLWQGSQGVTREIGQHG